MLFLNSILAGFAFTVVVQLLPISTKDKAVERVIGTFIITTTVLVVSIFGDTVLILNANIFVRSFPEMSMQVLTSYLMSVSGYVAIMFGLTYLGLITFLIGVGMSGYIYSKRIGRFTSIVAALAGLGFCLILFFFATSVTGPLSTLGP
jgi:hypothetical protein